MNGGSGLKEVKTMSILDVEYNIDIVGADGAKINLKGKGSWVEILTMIHGLKQGGFQEKSKENKE